MKVVVLSPHPDDDAIGCGGTMLKRLREGAALHSIYITSGEKGGCPEERSEREHIVIREDEAGFASQILHQYLYFLHEEDSNVQRASAHEKLLRIFDELHPDEIFAPHLGEEHPDHQVTAELAKELSSEFEIPAWGYEVWTPLDRYDLLENITSEAGMKRSAIRAHKSQAQNAFEEAALALNHYRGILHGPNILYAEVFKRL